MQNAKGRLQSKTLWINGLALLLALATLAADFLNLLNSPNTPVRLSPEVLAWYTFALAAVNIVLRHLTTRPIQGYEKGQTRAEDDMDPPPAPRYVA